MTAKPTPLKDFHLAQNARMVDFFGWELPLSYSSSGIIAEHRHTRQHCSLFDVSHMCQMQVSGDGSAEALERILPITAKALKPGRNKYSFACNEQGGILDDMIVGNDGDCYFVVCNASRVSAIQGHFNEHIGDSCELAVLSERALLAVQGPRAQEALEGEFQGLADLYFMDSMLATKDSQQCRISRSGYTGEDGFEISAPPDIAMALAQKLIDGGVCRPAGLGARDTLRIEAGLCLYGNEMGEAITPAEAGLAWAMPPSARSRASFIGAKKTLGQLEGGPPRTLVGFKVDGKAVLRKGERLMNDGLDVGVVTSGTHSPTLGVPVALALVSSSSAAVGQGLRSVLRGKEVFGKIVPLPFVEHKYRIKKKEKDNRP